MGAWVDTIRVYKMDKNQVKSQFESYQDQMRYEYGNNGYTGTLAECPGITFIKGLHTLKAAHEKIRKDAEKWENALAVPVLEGSSMYYLVGGVCSS